MWYILIIFLFLSNCKEDNMAGNKYLAKAKVRGGNFQVKTVPVNSRTIKTPLGYQKKETPSVPKLSNN